MAPRTAYQQCEGEDSKLPHGPSTVSTEGRTEYRAPQLPARLAPTGVSAAPTSRLKSMGALALALAALVGAIVYMRGRSGTLRMKMETTLLSEDDGLVPAFKQCGGKGVAERTCANGCLCTDESGNGYFKMCKPPDGYTDCNVEAAEEGLAKLREEFTAADDKLKVATSLLEDAKVASSKAWGKEDQAKRALQKANHTLDSAQTAARAKQMALAAKMKAELKEAQARLVKVTENAKEKSAGKKKEADQKLEEAEGKMKDVSGMQGDILKKARKERDEAIEAARAELKKAEEKLVRTKAAASMDKQDAVNAAKKRVEETKQAQEKTLEKTKEALVAKKEAEEEYSDLEEKAGAVEDDMDRYLAAGSGGAYEEEDDDDDYYD